MPYSLPDLPYAYDALEPAIDAQTMETHHAKHHQAYIDKVNDALKDQANLVDKDIEALISELDGVPESIRTAVRNNGGGHANHSLFWTIMSPDGGGEPEGDLAQAIDDAFGGIAQFKEQFTETAKGRFGSGWAWLVVQDGLLVIGSTANQDSPLMGERVAGFAGIPILGLDVWEHAYYLRYKNKRPDYIEAWWSVVNWQEVDRRYQAVM